MLQTTEHAFGYGIADIGIFRTHCEKKSFLYNPMKEHAFFRCYKIPKEMFPKA